MFVYSRPNNKLLSIFTNFILLEKLPLIIAMSGVKCYEWSATTTATTATNCHSQAQNTSVAITTDTVSHYFLDEVPLHLTGLDSTGGK